MMKASLTADRARYTIEHRHGCVLIFGAVPADAISALSKLVPKKSVIDPDVARMAGANFAFGLADDLAALRQEFSNAAVARETSKPTNAYLSPAAINWLASGERGISSDTLFSTLTGVDAMNGFAPCHPWDPADYRRCALLLDQCPELRSKLDLMRAVSPTWNALVDRWDEIFALMAEETKNWRSPPPNAKSPKTYTLMQSIIFPFRNSKS